jgi:hypothetical protein
VTEPLFDIPQEARALTGRQSWIYQIIVNAGADGLTADELGALLHGRKHDFGERCEFCPRDGLRALHEAAISARVVKRGHVYVAIGVREDVAEVEIESSVQVGELPGESFEDIFGSEEAA